MIVDLGEMNGVVLEFEDLLQRADVRDGRFLRSFFVSDESAHRADFRASFPALAALLDEKKDRIDQGFAALRQASQYTELLQHLQGQFRDHTPTPKPRPDQLLFACGDVCQHRMFGRCVVVGWDETCQQGEAWVLQNRIRQNLTFGTEQPFYQVLLEADGVPRYCSQENLALLADQQQPAFAHPHAPFYFRRLGRADGFVPSEALGFVYPGDADAASSERDYRSLDEARERVAPGGEV
jgi:hemimethylated DNA binding protein